jgi:hypothetical protein
MTRTLGKHIQDLALVEADLEQSSCQRKTGGEKTHRRLLIRHAELILEILTVGHSKFTWTIGILPAIGPTSRYVGDSTLIRNVIYREP